ILKFFKIKKADQIFIFYNRFNNYNLYFLYLFIFTENKKINFRKENNRKKIIINTVLNTSNMNNRLKKRDITSEEYNDNGHIYKRLKAVANEQENHLYITSSKIKKLIKNSNMEELKNTFDISKFYDDEFIK
ncbi:hypothetical protein H8356DRAFT_886773, partial [Neocallimastix lanati (nom. inval.)]